DSTFTDEERKRLDRAQHLLKVALDESATQAERQLAYKRVRDELDGLILLSDDAVDILEKKVAGELGPVRTAEKAPENSVRETPMTPPDPQPMPAQHPIPPARKQRMPSPPPAPGERAPGQHPSA